MQRTQFDQAIISTGMAAGNIPRGEFSDEGDKIPLAGFCSFHLSTEASMFQRWIYIYMMKSGYFRQHVFCFTIWALTSINLMGNICTELQMLQFC